MTVTSVAVVVLVAKANKDNIFSVNTNQNW